MSTPRTSSSLQTGFGLGLRTPHYADFLAGAQAVDWLEIITDNFLVDGGKPLVMLERIRRDYPMAMHGVAMSLGSAEGLDRGYLHRVKALAERVQPLWVSDHLCWTGSGRQVLHDLYPLPYTDEAARRVIEHIRQAQDLLQRQLVIENVSSYIRHARSACEEWEFLDHVAREADCLLLLDVNNVYVSSVNHGFDPLDYVRGISVDRVRQIHLAGHTDHGDHLIDTHDHPVSAPVWDLYRAACHRFGAVATMIERDDHIPPLAELITELDEARRVRREALAPPHAPEPVPEHHLASGRPDQALRWRVHAAPHEQTLAALQRDLVDCVLDRQPPERVLAQLDDGGPLDASRGVAIYRHAYRVRLADVLADTLPRVRSFLGDELFGSLARAHAVAHPPQHRHLGRYGNEFASLARQHYPDNPELPELITLDLRLRQAFDGADVPALTAAQAQADAAAAWLHRTPALHPSVRLLPVTTNVVVLWKALDADEPVPPVAMLPAPRTVAVWRRALQPHFRMLDEDEAVFIQALLDGCRSVAQVADQLAGSPALPDTSRLAAWLAAWWDEGLLAGPQPAA